MKRWYRYVFENGDGELTEVVSSDGLDAVTANNDGTLISVGCECHTDSIVNKEKVS